MRIPRVHDLTLGYIDQFGLALRPFVMGNPKGLVYVGGKRMTAEQAGLAPDELGFEVAEQERGRSYGDLWDAATRELRAMVDADGEAGWERLRVQYDGYSIREFLESEGLLRGRHRDVRRHELRRVRDQQRRHRGVPRGLRQGLRGHAGDRRRHRQPAERLLPRDPGPDPLRRGGPRDRPGRGRRDGPLQDRVRPLVGARRLRDRHPAVLGAPAGRGPDALLAGEAARDPPAQLLRVDQDPVPGQRADLGAGGRDLRRRDRHGPADPPHQLPDARSRPRPAACCSRATRGTRTRPAGARWTRRPASRRRSRTSPGSTPGSARSTRSAPPTPGTTTASPTARSPCSSRASRPRSRRTSSGRRAGSTSPASTARCTTPGSRGRSNRASARRGRSTRRRSGRPTRA